jgi:hypothetical protein
MWREDPEQLLMMAKRRGAELRAEAAAVITTARRASDFDRFSGLKIRMGSVLIMVGRTLADENRPPDPVRS